LKEVIDFSFPRFFRFFASNSVDSEEGRVLVCEFEGMVVGFAKFIDFVVAKHKYGCVLWLAINPKHRRRGIASALVNTGFERLKKDGAEAVFASVQRRNKASLATFHKAEFENVGFTHLWRIFSWRIFHFYTDIWYAPGEIVLMNSKPSSPITNP
jgi:ribosomal protein S18 acetylase RimI-like enzyme